MNAPPRTHMLSRLLYGVPMAAVLAAPAPAQMYINEIFFDPGGGASDIRDEFIEIRGVPNTNLQDHYLLFLENELDQFGIGEAGTIDNLFDLGEFSLGSNGFLVLQQKFSRYTADQVNPGATQLINDGPNKPGPALPGFGNNAPGAEGSTVGASDLPSNSATSTGAIENSGFTAMLIRNDSGEAPTLGLDLDENNDGLDVPTGREGWTILDSVGVFGELDETEFGRLYGAVNFGVVDDFFPPDFVPNVPEGTEFELVEYEIEYIGRWGNSTGSRTIDWHLSNLTDNPNSGSTGVNGNDGPVDLRQSGDPHPSNPNPENAPPQPPLIESNQGVPYGTPLLTNLGGPNYITGDYNADGIVDAADYTVWRDTNGTTGSNSDQPAADANHDFVVDATDYQTWAARFGGPNAALPTPASGVPEPTTASLVAIFACAAVRLRTRAGGRTPQESTG